MLHILVGQDILDRWLGFNNAPFDRTIETVVEGTSCIVIVLITEIRGSISWNKSTQCDVDQFTTEIISFTETACGVSQIRYTCVKQADLKSSARWCTPTRIHMLGKWYEQDSRFNPINQRWTAERPLKWLWSYTKQKEQVGIKLVFTFCDKST